MVDQLNASKALTGRLTMPAAPAPTNNQPQAGAPASTAIASMAKDLAATHDAGDRLNTAALGDALGDAPLDDRYAFKNLLADTVKKSFSGGMESIAKGITKLLDRIGVDQFWPNSCVGAAAQQLWKEDDPVGYGNAADGLVKTGTLTLPNGEKVTVPESTEKLIRERADGDPKKYEEMMMQAALMIKATDGKWNPLADSLDFFDGTDQGAIMDLLDALDMPGVNLTMIKMAAELTGRFGGNVEAKYQEQVGKAIDKFFRKNPDQPLMLTIDTPSGNHEVTVTPLPDGTYNVTNSDKSTPDLPPGMSNPLTLEQLSSLVPLDADDVGNRRQNPTSFGGGEFGS